MGRGRRCCTSTGFRSIDLHQQPERKPMAGKKVALVTGANKGIGFEICRQLGRHGFTVVLAARDEKKVADAAARLQGEGLEAHGIVLDVTNASSAEAAAKWIAKGTGGSMCW